MRRFSDYTRSSLSNDEAEEKLRDREFIIKMNAIAHNQLSSPVYRPMLVYAWQRPGYTVEEQVSSFQSVLEINFSNFNDPCVIDDCDNQCFIRLGYFPCESYSHIVRLINDVKSIMGIHNGDYLFMDSRYIFSKDNLQAMMDAYIGDIEMVQKCEVSLGRPNRVDMKIVERIKSLSNELQNYYFPKDDGFFAEVSSISRKTMDQCLWRFEFLLNKFTATFINFKM
uniref:Uncharacterized protein n=1 Tax=Tetranychus urticae TaxID=32264 RepID=T1KSL9_TETUR